MVDREMALRFLAFHRSRPENFKSTDFDQFLRQVMRELNLATDAERVKLYSEFTDSMVASSRIFGIDAFRKRYREQDPRRPVSKALFESIAVAIAGVLERHGSIAIETLEANRESVKSKFMALINDREFDRSISQATGDPVRVRVRFEKVKQMLESILETI